ncbi:MAG: L-threonylcarbamoyladenylate synthase [Acidobacteriota bacterium]
MTCYLVQVVRFDVNFPSPDTIQQASQAIRRGQIVLHPTDTVYGLACDPFDQDALGRLFALKGRSSKSGVLLLIPDPIYCEEICDDIPQVFYELSDRLWPGPVTLLLRGKPSLPALLLGNEGKVGLRQPDLPWLKLWMEGIPGAIVSTSANRSGQATPVSLEELRLIFESEVDLFLEGDEVAKGTQASTVVDLTVTPPQLVRAGRWTHRVQACLKDTSAGDPS